MAYSNTREHLFDELAIVDTILDGAEYATIDRGADGPDLGTDDQTADPAVDPDQLTYRLPDPVLEDLQAHEERIDQRIQDTDGDVGLRLQTMVDRFDLSRNHLTVFMLALAPDLEAKYETVFEHLQEESGAKRATIGFVATLFGADSAEQAAATVLVGPGSPLRRYGLIEISEPAGTSTSHRHRMLGVDPRLISYLEGHDDVDPALTEIATVERPETTLADLRLDEETADRLADLAARRSDDRRIYYFYGEDGSEKRRAVEALSAGRVLQANLDELLAVDGLERFRREAMLQDCPVHLTHATRATDHLSGKETADDRQEKRDRPTINRVIETLSVLDRDLFVTGTDRWTPTPAAHDDRYSLLHFPKPGYTLRTELWETYADELADDVDVDVLANTFELTQGQIDGAVATARALSDQDESVEASEAGKARAQSDALSWEAIVEGCNAQSARGLDHLADRIDPETDWDDIVLPESTERQLRHVASHIKHRGTVFEEWGFDERFSRGKGVVALFAGPSGTGKTMAAEIIAADTGMSLYKIDLSSVVSKYIGETEENLERIFDAAKDSNAILLFDEADAVFGQRAGVSDATDRYANVEVNYLLQRIETYDGVVILTSNYESHIDDAFMRRIHQSVSFRRPEEDIRGDIWRIMFPEETPVDELDYEFLADLDLTGGNIRNVAQTAAVLAAEADESVTMKHVVKAIRFEYDKIDKLIEPDEFGEYKEYLGRIVERPASADDSPRRRRRRPGVVTNRTDRRQSPVDSDGLGDQTEATPDNRADGQSESADGELEPAIDPPEAVAEEFFGHLSAGNKSALQSLYHTKAIVDEFSRTDLKIHQHADMTIESDFTRVLETHNRVVLQFVQRLNDDRMHIEYELRKEGGEWRMYDLGKAGQRSPFKR